MNFLSALLRNWLTKGIRDQNKTDRRWKESLQQIKEGDGNQFPHFSWIGTNSNVALD